MSDKFYASKRDCYERVPVKAAAFRFHVPEPSQRKPNHLNLVVLLVAVAAFGALVEYFLP